MALNAGDIIFSIKGDITGLNKAMVAAKASADKNFGAVSKAAGVAMTAAGAAITGFAAASVFSYAQAGDEIQKMALKTGFSTEKLSELRHAAEQGGASFEAIGKSSKKLSTVILEAGQGVATYTDALGFLGLKYDDLKALTPEEQFMKVALSLADVENAGTRAAVAQEIFGRSGVDLLPMLANGSAGIAEMAAEAHKLGIVFDQEGADSAAAFNDALDFLKKSMAGLMFIVAESLIPTLTEFARWAGDIIISMREWADEHPGLAQAITTIVVGVGALMFALGPLIIALPGIIAAWPAIAGGAGVAGTALVAMTGPVGWVIGGIVALAIAAWALVDDWGQVWEDIKTVTVNAVSFVVDALTPLFELIGGLVEGINWLGNSGGALGIAQSAAGYQGRSAARGGEQGGGGLGSSNGPAVTNHFEINLNSSGSGADASTLADEILMQLKARGFA